MPHWILKINKIITLFSFPCYFLFTFFLVDFGISFTARKFETTNDKVEEYKCLCMFCSGLDSVRRTRSSCTSA